MMFDPKPLEETIEKVNSIFPFETEGYTSGFEVRLRVVLEELERLESDPQRILSVGAGGVVWKRSCPSWDTS